MAKEVFQRTKPHVNVGTIGHKLQKLGFSPLAVHELTTGQCPTTPNDRALLVQRFAQIVERCDPTIFRGELVSVEPRF